MMFTIENVLIIISYLMMMIMLGLIYFTWKQRKEVKHWGYRLLGLFTIGLLLCIVAAMRDQYHLSVIALNDPSQEPGLFLANGFQSTSCMILGGVNMLILLLALFIKKPDFRKTMYWILSTVIIMKLLLIELSILFY